MTQENETCDSYFVFSSQSQSLRLLSQAKINTLGLEFGIWRFFFMKFTPRKKNVNFEFRLKL